MHMNISQRFIKTVLLFLVIVLINNGVFAVDYPFQDPRLSDDARLDNLISLMTLDEKIDHLFPMLPGIPRLGVKGTRTVEGLHGLAWSGPANWAVKGKGEAPTTTFPQAIGLAQMWDTDLLKKIADWEAYEARYLAQNSDFGTGGLIVFAPNADLGRDIRWGRTEECFGEDPFLAAAMTVAYVKGLQGDNPRYWKTASLMKHFLANSNENNRFVDSSNFDERLFREYYSYPFYKGVVEGGSRAFMAAYNKYNGIPCTVHPVLKNVTIKEWGQNGIICTDGGAFKRLVDSHKYYKNYTEAAEACIHSGITMFLDEYKPYVQKALDRGLINEKDIDDAVRGTLRVMLKLGLMDSSPDNPYNKIGINDREKPWMKKEAMLMARKATVRSIVLLKNNGLLPLKKEEMKSIAVIGPSADLVVSDWYSGTPPYRISILDGIRNYVENDVIINYATDNKADAAVEAASKSDVAVVCIGNHPLSYGLGWGENHVASDGREDVDRQAISLEQEDLVRLVKAANPSTILVLVSSFPYAIPWSKENVPAILHVAQSSQELGSGIADILFGRENPAGRLVQTWSSSIDRLPPILDYNIRNGRTYMYDRYSPLFAFGHGLSYTNFKYSGLVIDREILKEGETIHLTVNVKNIGPMDGDEVVQIYVSYPNSKIERPVKSLKGFKRIHIPRDRSASVSIPLKAQDLTYWNTAKHDFILEKGIIRIMVGAASDDIRLTSEVEVR
jgi:beta-glucosidase